jgi:putative DNA primase/helicase
MSDLVTLKLDLAARAGELARELLGSPNKELSNSRTLRFGSKGSLAIGLPGSKRQGRFKDFESSEEGSLLDLIVRERGGSLFDAIKFAEAFAGRPAKVQEPEPASLRSAPDEDDASRTRRALSIWDAARPALDDTPAASYLQQRRIDLPHGIAGDVLRFHPACPFGEDGKRVPALVALMRDIHSNEPQAIHRTALTPAGVKVGRKVFGPKQRTAIKFTPNEDVSHGLTIGEGIETTLAAMMLGFSPAWAVGDAGELGDFPVLAGVECLTILVDNDLSGTGQRRALECSQRWTAAGCEVFRAVPVSTGADFNDIVKERAA